MASDPAFAMALRTGNWKTSVMLPFHKPVAVTLAPVGAPDQLVVLEAATGTIPRVLTAADVTSVVVADSGGRALLEFDAVKATLSADRGASFGGSHGWELRLAGRDGTLVLYSRDERLPEAADLARLRERLRSVDSVA